MRRCEHPSSNCSGSEQQPGQSQTLATGQHDVENFSANRGVASRRQISLIGLLP
jgi:hypothetical protein